MFTNLPFTEDYPIVQQFGDSPRAYGSLLCGGVPVRGHPGVDFAMPAGTPVLAVAPGVVLAVQEDALGFGIYLLLQHHWGQTLYAHLSKTTCVPGQPIKAGQQIGLSGNTGLTLQPHLHFAIRITPYILGDGWCGYTDPAPYLHRLTRGRGPLIGPHIIGGVHRRLDLLRRWQPRLIVVIDPNPDEMRLLRQACPHTVVIGRPFESDHVISERIRTDPLKAARWAHEKTLPRVTPDVDYWQFTNEILQDAAGLPLLNAFELERMRLAGREPVGRKYRCALFGFSVGNPDLPESRRLAHWRLIYPALRQAETEGHILALHQYGMPDLWGPDGLRDWYIYRLEHQVLRRIPFKRLQFAVTECGIDGLIRGSKPSGWQDYAGDRDYLCQLTKHAAYLERFSGRMLGVAVFTLGHFAPWGAYDIEGPVADALAGAAQRGTWSEVNANVTDLVPADAGHTPDPGVETLPDASDGACADPSARPPYMLLLEQRLDRRFSAYNMRIKSLDQRPDRPQSDDLAYVIKDIFMTANGSWEITGSPDDVPQWAKDDYLTPTFLEAGADHHLFGTVLGLDGTPVRDMRITYWSDGFDRLGDPEYDGYVTIRVNPQSCWANLSIAGGSAFVPERGDTGPWCWMPQGAAEVVCGGGLPLRRHVSTFVVWQTVRREDLDERLSAAAGDGLYPGALAHPLARRISQWATYFNLAIRPLPARAATQDGPPLFVKDLFTSLIGSGGTCDTPGALPSWANEQYRIPPQAITGDADAAPRVMLYAAVCNARGVLVPAHQFLFSSNGLDCLQTGHAPHALMTPADDESGWASLAMNPSSSYSPDRGQSGPWCWAPRGATEAVCGGGIPSGQSLAVFAVWQAIPQQP